jgi:hypothetical protein
MRKLIFIFSILLFFSCKKEKKITYHLNDVKIENNTANKDHLKSTIEFISIAYSDIFGTVISTNKLAELSQIYKAFGDKKLLEQMVIKNFLNGPSIQITQIDRSSSITINSFVQNVYTKLYNRTPDEYELWFISNMIEKDTDLTSELIYFSLMTANEYRYY